jgi:phage terminase large subunit
VDAVAISALATKASLASPKEQCFLYAELVHRMTELAGHQMKDGQDASATLRGIRDYTQKIHLGVAKDTKRLKNAQILMEHTAFRLNEYLHSAAIDDRPVLESTLKNLNQVQDELMLQVFRR